MAFALVCILLIGSNRERESKSKGDELMEFHFE
jgi:hypothetical protein